MEWLDNHSTDILGTDHETSRIAPVAMTRAVITLTATSRDADDAGEAAPIRTGGVADRGSPDPFGCGLIGVGKEGVITGDLVFSTGIAHKSRR